VISGLRARVLAGGVYLTLRRGISILLSTIGAFYITNIIGPAGYGLFASVMGIFTFLKEIGHLGLRVYLIRESKDETVVTAYQAFYLGLIWSLMLSLGAAFCLYVAGHYWVRTPSFIAVALTTIAFLPCTVLAMIVGALLEREILYKQVATVELISLFSQYLVGIPLAWWGYGVWALVAGWGAQQVLALLGVIWLTGFRPRWYWNRRMVGSMMRYGISYSISNWLFHLRHLIPAFVVLPLAGEEVAGHIGLARRLVELLSFAREAASRLALPVLATLREDKTKMLRAISEGMRLHTLSASFFYVPAALLIPYLIKGVFKVEWNAQEVGLAFAFTALSYLIQGIFMLHSSALYAYKYNMTVGLANASYFVLLLASSAVLLPHFGVWGYGLSLLSTAPSFLIFHFAITHVVGRPDYRAALLWLGGFTAAIFAPVLNTWLYGLAVLLLIHPTSVREFVQLYHHIQAVQRSKLASTRAY
jgi:PST family polysaccharide transporter